MRHLILIAHNLRSSHNIGSLLRTADGLGIERVYLTGYSPYPKKADDSRLPYVADKAHAQIAKTALGAEESVMWEQRKDVFELLSALKSAGYSLVAIEQTSSSLSLPDFKPGDKLALIVGREVEGLEAEVLDAVDRAVEIPMFGKKESFNVVQAAAMALYHCRFAP